jgi:hypothetical protein
MEGSRIPNPFSDLAQFAAPRAVARGGACAALAFGVTLFLLTASVHAESNLVSPPLGQPIVLFLPSVPAGSTPAAPVHTATSAPAKKSKPLIPPAPTPAKLGPPPDPRPPMPLEIDLQPLGPAAQTPPGAAPQTAKSPSG